jgi:hypothetical protein
MATMALLQSNRELFDPFRKKWVKATPEEIVRQKWLQVLVFQLKFPKELIAVEKELKELAHITASPPERRADIICFAKDIHPDHSLYPLLLIECKEDKSLQAEATEQVIGYNHFVNAYFIAAICDTSVQFGFFDKELKSYKFFPSIPSYLQLVQSIQNA